MYQPATRIAAMMKATKYEPNEGLSMTHASGTRAPRNESTWTARLIVEASANRPAVTPTKISHCEAWFPNCFVCLYAPILSPRHIASGTEKNRDQGVSARLGDAAPGFGAAGADGADGAGATCTGATCSGAAGGGGAMLVVCSVGAPLAAFSCPGIGVPQLSLQD